MEIVDVPEQTTATRRARLPAAELPAFFAAVYTDVMAAVVAQGLAVTGEPFAAYHGMPGETVDVEAGMPVDGVLADADDIRSSTLPACRAAIAMHVGPFEGLADTWGELMAWVGEQHLSPSGPLFWESYLTDPEAEPDPSAWRTRLVIPVG